MPTFPRSWQQRWTQPPNVGVGASIPTKTSSVKKTASFSNSPSGSEVRVTDPSTGGQKGTKLERFDLIPAEELEAVARVYGRGAQKYAERNWERGYAWGLSFAAMMRHAWLFWRGQSYDEETGLHHLAQVVFHCFALMRFERLEKGTDDRSKG
jgi:Domain of unknown function (DUF5664)